MQAQSIRISLGRRALNEATLSIEIRVSARVLNPRQFANSNAILALLKPSRAPKLNMPGGRTFTTRTRIEHKVEIATGLNNTSSKTLMEVWPVRDQALLVETVAFFNEIIILEIITGRYLKSVVGHLKRS